MLRLATHIRESLSKTLMNAFLPLFQHSNIPLFHVAIKRQWRKYLHISDFLANCATKP
jgi:hypothetical protein